MKNLRLLPLLATMLSMLILLPAAAADRAYPDPDTEKPCSSASENQECALKTFWMCSEQTVETCKAVGLDVGADGAQRKDDSSAAADAWLRPWSVSWNEILNIASKDHDVWELRGTRDVSRSRIRGLRRAPRPIIGTQEMMVYMVGADKVVEKASVFMEQRKEAWVVVAFARWRDDESVNLCERKKQSSLACRYIVTGMAPW